MTAAIVDANQGTATLGSGRYALLATPGPNFDFFFSRKDATLMPYKSKAQMRYFFWAEKHNKLPKGTAEEWAHHTKNRKDLPEHVKKALEIYGLPRVTFMDRIFSKAIGEGRVPAPLFASAGRGEKLAAAGTLRNLDASGSILERLAAIARNASGNMGKCAVAPQQLPAQQQMPQSAPTPAANIKPRQAQPLVPPTAQAAGMPMGSAFNQISRQINPTQPYNPQPLAPSNYQQLAQMKQGAWLDRLVKRAFHPRAMQTQPGAWLDRLVKRAFHPRAMQMQPGMNPGMMPQQFGMMPGMGMQPQGMFPQQFGMMPGMWMQPQGMFPQQFGQMQMPGGAASVQGPQGMQPYDVNADIGRFQDTQAYLQQIAAQYPITHPYGREARQRLQFVNQHLQRLQAVAAAQAARNPAANPADNAGNAGNAGHGIDMAALERLNPDPFARPAQANSPAQAPAQPAAAAGPRTPTPQERSLYEYMQNSQRMTDDFLRGVPEDMRQQHKATLGDNARLADLQRTNPQLYEQIRNRFMGAHAKAYAKAYAQQNPMDETQSSMLPGFLSWFSTRPSDAAQVSPEELQRRGLQDAEEAWRLGQSGTLGQLAQSNRHVADWLPEMRREHAATYRSPQQIAAEANPAWATATDAQRAAILQNTQAPPVSAQQLAANPRFAALPPEQQAQIRAYHENRQVWDQWRQQYTQRYGVQPPMQPPAQPAAQSNYGPQPLYQTPAPPQSQPAGSQPAPQGSQMQNAPLQPPAGAPASNTAPYARPAGPTTTGQTGAAGGQQQAAQRPPMQTTGGTTSVGTQTPMGQRPNPPAQPAQIPSAVPHPGEMAQKNLSGIKVPGA